MLLVAVPNPFTGPIDRPIEIVNNLVIDINKFYQEMIAMYIRNYNRVWHNDTDPILIVQKMGTQAVRIFSHSAAIGALLASENAVDPATGKPVPTAIPSNYTATYNPDGTITLVKTS